MIKKNLLVFAAALVIGVQGMGQSIEEIKTQLLLNQVKKAKELVDAAASKPKVTAKPEYFILRASIYGSFLNDKTSPFQSDTLRQFIVNDYNKYMELDKSKKLIAEPNYSNIPIQLYINFYNEASQLFNKQKWDDASNSFDQTIYWSDFISSNKFADLGTVDTNAVVLAGASNQNAKREEKAAEYYERLIKAKVTGKDYEFLYQYMVDLYYRKNNIEGFERVKKLGKELYPENDYFKNEEIDFMMSIEDDKERMKRLDVFLQKNPDNFKAFAAKGDILFETLNPRDEGVSVPANYDELEVQMTAAFNRATELDPTYGYGMSNLGYHFINRTVRLDKALNAQRKVMADKAAEARKNTPPAVKGKPAPPPFKQSQEDISKRDSLQAQIVKSNDNAIMYFEKAKEIYKKNPNLSGIQKQQYKSAVNYLIDLYKEKKDKSQPGSADEKKFAAKEKENNELYTELSKQ